jgi:hypothetical protein
LDAFFVFCAFTKLAALCRARRTSTWAEEAGTEEEASFDFDVTCCILHLERGKSNNRTRGRRQITTRNISICIPTIKLILC